MEYNKVNGITPQTIIRNKESILGQTKVADAKKSGNRFYVENESTTLAADPVMSYLPKEELTKIMEKTRKEMERAAKDLEFMEAARLRDEFLALQKLIEEKSSKN